MAYVETLDEQTLSTLLKYCDSGDFIYGCKKMNVSKYIAIELLLKAYPRKRKEIINNIIAETDPSMIETIHVGNYEQKATAFRRIFEMDVVDDGKTKFTLNRHSLIFGNAGIGKTLFVQSLKEDFEIIEVNASITNTDEAIVRQIQGGMQTESLLGKPKIIFFDEIDYMSKSGFRTLANLIGPSIKQINEVFDLAKVSKKKSARDAEKMEKMRIALYNRSRFPIIMACNDIVKVSNYVKGNDRVKVIQFSSPEPFEIEALLTVYANLYWDGAEAKVSASLEKNDIQIRQIANDCDGDIRVAKNMLLGGSKYEKEMNHNLVDISYVIFTMDDRENVLKILSETIYPISVILDYISININKYYDKLTEIYAAHQIVSFLDELKYKTRKEYIYGVIAFGFKPSAYKNQIPDHPPRKVDKDNGKESKKSNE